MLMFCAQTHLQRNDLQAIKSSGSGGGGGVEISTFKPDLKKVLRFVPLSISVVICKRRGNGYRHFQNVHKQDLYDHFTSLLITVEIIQGLQQPKPGNTLTTPAEKQGCRQYLSLTCCSLARCSMMGCWCIHLANVIRSLEILCIRAPNSGVQVIRFSCQYHVELCLISILVPRQSPPPPSDDLTLGFDVDVKQHGRDC